ncbi:hypothetical protein Fot_04758 [Forsythia ovata]|uniref:Prolactin receptor n=1 Tax=Forsythia ovata TaxID=205694 RepID=A0ABD1XDH7_9LAMI
MDASSHFLPNKPLLSSKSVRWQDKGKRGVEEDSEARGQKSNAGDDGIMRDAKVAKQGGVLSPSQGTEKSTHSPRSSRLALNQGVDESFLQPDGMLTLSPPGGE